jgi:hypothetical protein
MMSRVCCGLLLATALGCGSAVTGPAPDSTADSTSSIEELDAHARGEFHDEGEDIEGRTN